MPFVTARARGDCLQGQVDRHQVVIVEEHHHALPYWYEAARREQQDRQKASGAGNIGIGDRKKLLVHIDTHDDLALPRSGGNAPWNDAAALPNHFVTRNDCFILDAVVRGLLDEIVFVRFLQHDENQVVENIRRRSKAAESVPVALPHYSGVLRIGVVMHRHIARFPPSLWREGADSDSLATVPVWCVCGDPAGLHSGDSDSLAAALLGAKSSSDDVEIPPCYYNTAQALQDPRARTLEEIAQARQWGEKSEMDRLPVGTFCNLAKGWREGGVLEWPSDGKPMGSSLSSGQYDEAEAKAGGVHEATVHVAMLRPTTRGEGRTVAREIGAAVHEARKRGLVPGRWYRSTYGSGEDKNEDKDIVTVVQDKGWVLDIDEDFFFPDYSPAVVLDRMGADGIAMENLWWSMRPLEFYTARQEHQMDEALRAAMAALQVDDDLNGADSDGGSRLKLEEWTSKLATEFERWHRKVHGEQLRKVLREVLRQLGDLPAVVQNNLQDVGFCKSMMTTASDAEYGLLHPQTQLPTFDDFAHTIPSYGALEQHHEQLQWKQELQDEEEQQLDSGDFGQQAAMAPMRLNVCLGETWFDDEHVSEYERISDQALHPDRLALRHRSAELREFLEEIAGVGRSTSRSHNNNFTTADTESDVNGDDENEDSRASLPFVSRPPLLTSICRSNRDGYAPRKEAAAVESALLSHLRALQWANGEGSSSDGDKMVSKKPSRRLHEDEWLLGLVGGRHEDL
eukprot:COSAG02_NODE_4355_length_5460_cov_2.632904_3_plen_739_part_00